MRVLITGANGFLGKQLVASSLRKGYHTIAMVRPGRSIPEIQDNQLRLVKVDYSDASALSDTIHQVSHEGGLDAFIHNAGLTISARRQDFFDVNVNITRSILEVVKSTNALSQTGKFVYVSSLAARGPDGHSAPVSAYGDSKLAAEKLVQNSAMPFVIYRPTGIYGPGDLDFLKLFKVLKAGFAPRTGPKDQKISMIFAQDLADLILSNKGTDQIHEVCDGQVYSLKQFYDAITKTMNKKPATVEIPPLAGFLFAHLQVWSNKLFKTKMAATPEKLRELAGNWTCPSKDLNWTFTSLQEGLLKTFNYYQQKGLI
ncbi:MAG: SDR family NAD(P)-dependent oxidoreductase [Cyclobacteriaceae bacterium]|nr:SDR family NAD(P)-dependent oxidoreductase [Cyclobacteriaceae bacterium HetDA_MAG_MS6]